MPRAMETNKPGVITEFIRHHYRHFNAAALRAGADDYIKHLDKGGKMLVTLAGAMSTAEIGLSLAEIKALPGTDLNALCARIRARVPELDAYDRDTYSRMCMEFWLTRTGIGISFGLAEGSG